MRMGKKMIVLLSLILPAGSLQGDEEYHMTLNVQPFFPLGWYLYQRAWFDSSSAHWDEGRMYVSIQGSGNIGIDHMLRYLEDANEKNVKAFVSVPFHAWPVDAAFEYHASSLEEILARGWGYTGNPPDSIHTVQDHISPDSSLIYQFSSDSNMVLCVVTDDAGFALE